MTDRVRKVVYLPPQQWDRWEADLEESGCATFSEWNRGMVEAELKTFDARVEPDESWYELREQNNDLKEELDRTREWAGKLEKQSYYTDQAAAARYVEENPDAEFSAIIDHVLATAPDRIARFLDIQSNSTDVDWRRYHSTHEISTLLADIAHEHRTGADDVESPVADSAEFLAQYLAEYAESERESWSTEGPPDGDDGPVDGEGI